MLTGLSSTRRCALVLALWALAAAGSVSLVISSQGQTHREIERRFDLRASIASRFVTSYVHDLTSRQIRQAQRHLATPHVSDREFQRTVGDSGLGAAALLDSRGRVLHLVPPSPALLGTDLTTKYQHLKTAVGGHVAISKVVRSAVEGLPVVAFATPFKTAVGMRVFSGAYDISKTPAGNYLKNAIPISQSRLYLIDSSGVIIAQNRGDAKGLRTLKAAEPGLARGLVRHTSGSFELGGDEQRYASAAIAGTPWRVVVAVPASLLYASTSGPARWAPWLIVAGFILASLLGAVAILNNAAGRIRLAALNEVLERVVDIDPLTAVYNRRGLGKHLAASASAAARHRRPLALAVIDVDRFKQINDTHGHPGGDAVLTEIAAIMRRTIRAEDIFGRWGGEEFLAILHDTDIDSAIALGERLRSALEAHEIELPNGDRERVTVSIGVSAGDGKSVEELIRRADHALYAAKDGGRNRVEAAPASTVAFVA